MRLEIDMQPFATCFLRLLGRESNHPCGVALTALILRGHGVEQEGVNATVPSDIDETDQPAGAPKAYPAQAVTVDLAPSIVRQHGVPKGFGMQRIDFVIGEGATPFGDHIILSQRETSSMHDGVCES